MPIWLRNFTFNNMKTYYDKENEKYEEMKKKDKRSSKGVSKPDINPSYRTKRAPK